MEYDFNLVTSEDGFHSAYVGLPYSQVALADDLYSSYKEHPINTLKKHKEKLDNLSFLELMCAHVKGKDVPVKLAALNRALDEFEKKN